MGEREFIGKAWSSYLSEENLSYRMRIKKNTQIIHNNNKINLQEKLLGQKHPIYLMDCEVYGQRVNLVAVNKKEPLILIGNCNPKSFIEEYKKRWH